MKFSSRPLGRCLILVIALIGAGCQARNLDELSSSYERLAIQATEAQQANQQNTQARVPRQPTMPPVGSLGSAFLVVGRDALEAGSRSNADARTRIAFYRVAASSAHFVLLEEATTGREVILVPAEAASPAASGESAQSGAVIMLRAVGSGKSLCDGLQANRPPRDCTYLEMAASLANFAVVSEPWLTLPQPNAANTAQHISAFSRSPDQLFEPAWTAYKRDSGIALQKLGSAAGQSGGDSSALGPAEFIRNNDGRAFCTVATRATKVRALPAIPGVDMQRNTDFLLDARQWYSGRYGSGEPQCTS